jgi:hypothetical protein
MHLCALRRESIARQHHEMLPAIEAADAPVGPLINSESRAVALRPWNALAMCRDQFAMPAEDRSVAGNEKQAAIDRALSCLLPLHDADDDVDL